MRQEWGREGRARAPPRKQIKTLFMSRASPAAAFPASPAAPMADAGELDSEAAAGAKAGGRTTPVDTF